MTTSALAITDEHVELAEAVLGQLRRCKTLAAARATADGATSHPSEIWTAAANLGWHGLAVDEKYDGSGFGLAELAIVLEMMGHELCPGPFLPTAVLAATLSLCGTEEQRATHLPGLATAATVAAVVASNGVRLDDDGTATGTCPAVLGAPDADVVAVVVGDNVLLLDVSQAGIAVAPAAAALDTTRGIGELTLTGVRVDDERIIRGSAHRLRTIWRILAAAEALGSARGAMEMACDYAKVREQFGRTIGTFQAVKHHLANLLVDIEMTTAAVWDAARAGDVDSAGFAAAVATWHAVRTVVLAAEMNIQLHGGIGFTWEHDAHLYLRRARRWPPCWTAAMTRSAKSWPPSGAVRRPASLQLPEEAERTSAPSARVRGPSARELPAERQRDRLDRHQATWFPTGRSRGGGGRARSSSW